MERLHMQLIQDILHRLRQGQSERAIARDLGHSRITVHRYAGFAREHGYLDPAQPLPDLPELLAQLGPSLPPPRPPSTVEPYRSQIEEWLRQGVEGVAIHQRLVEQFGYTGSYSSVRRFLGTLRPNAKPATLRIETPPGQQTQIDFGSVGRLRDPQTGKERSAYCFVMTLSFSRHQYLEFVFDQSIPTWLRCHRNAFESFGGVPKEWVIDNLKAAVLQASLDDPVLSAPYRQMALHYGALIHPCRVRTPQHKGKVENGVHYVKRNFLAGQTFLDLDDVNRRGRRWVREIAGARDHGTTHQAPLRRFESQEKSTLLPLPAEPFRLWSVRTAKVHSDCHVTVVGSYYSVPEAFIGKLVEVHLYEATVEIYDGVTLLVTHSRAKERGERLTRREHYPASKALYLERTPEVCRERATAIGPSCRQVVEGLLEERPLDQLRSVQKLIGLETLYGASRVEAACARALRFGDPRYRRVKTILAAGLEADPLPEDALPETSISGAPLFEEPLKPLQEEEKEEGSADPVSSGGNRPPTFPSYTYARSIQEFFPAELFFETEPIFADGHCKTEPGEPVIEIERDVEREASRC